MNGFRGSVIPSPSKKKRQWKMVSGLMTVKKKGKNKSTFKYLNVAGAVMINDNRKLESSSYLCRKWNGREDWEINQK